MKPNEILRCTTCNRKTEFLGYEKTVIPIVPEGSAIGVHTKIQGINIHLYCDHCKCNASKFIHYKTEDSILPFVNDCIKLSARFDKKTYRELP